MKIPRPLYLVLVISMLTLTESYAVQAQSSGLHLANISHTFEAALVQPCSV
jgi:hypothetical protein